MRIGPGFPRFSRPTGSVALWSLVVGILLVAAVLRLFWLDRYPAGWHHDEALMGVMAGEVYRGEEHPIFFRQYLGQEPLYIYLSAGMMALLGGNQDILPLRLTSALVGLLTVLVTFLLARRLFGNRVGLLSMALIGVSFWQVMSSRNGYRSITQPLLEGIAVYLLVLARARGGIRWYALSGLALGGTLYTYLGARAFPGVFVGFGLWLLLRGARPTRADLTRAGVLALVAIVVVAPLAAFFIVNPGTFSARMEQVFIFRPQVSGGHPWDLLADNVVKMLRIFTVSGDPLWRYNIPGRPVFVGAVALAFYVGIAVLVRRLWRRDDRAALVLVWQAAMFFPSLLSWDVGAYTLRAMGLVPALYLVPAVGLDWLWLQMGERWTWGRRVATVLVAVVLVVDTAWTARDYFVVWAPSFGASWEGMADTVAQARFLDRDAQPSQEDVFVANQYYHHPTLAQLARPVYPSLRWFDGQQSVVFSPETQRPALYVLAFNGMPPDVNALFPPSTLVASQYFSQGIDGGAPPPLFLAYRLTPDQIREQVKRLLADPRLHPVAGRITGLIEPLGERLDGPVGPGDTLKATLIWRVVAKPPPGQYQLLAQLVDQRWQELSDVEGLGYPPEEWRPGDVVWSQFDIPVPKGTPPGLDKVQVALYNRDTDVRLPIEGGQPGIAALVLGDVRVVAATAPRPPAIVLDARLGANVDLVGIDPPKLTQARALSVTLHWQTSQPPDQNYTAFVQLLNRDGQLVAQSDSWPAEGDLPTASWLPNEAVLDTHVLPLKPDLPPGKYRLIAGMYLLKTGQRLPVASGGDFVELGRVSLPLR
ncbi:MAG TPA: glycosyltransferase family 39 protein [Chloroflexota bacterium]|nr:glycosyltransferase family 39 protein [Chloroflexota bacterium]